MSEAATFQTIEHSRAYTPNELAKLTRVASAKRIRQAIRDGDLPAYRVGHWNRVRLDEFEAWLETLRVGPRRCC